jgi:hypothetical protein
MFPPFFPPLSLRAEVNVLNMNCLKFSVIASISADMQHGFLYCFNTSRIKCLFSSSAFCEHAGILRYQIDYPARMRVNVVVDIRYPVDMLPTMPSIVRA